MRVVTSPVDATSVVVLVVVLREPVAPVVLVEPLVAPIVPLALVLLRDVSVVATEVWFWVVVSVVELDGVLLVEAFDGTEPLAPMPASLVEREVSVLEVVLLGEDEEDVVELLLGVVLATLELVSEEVDLVASRFVASVA